MPKDPVEVTVTVTLVRLVELRGSSAVVEYSDPDLKRVVIPAGEIIEGAVSQETLGLGIPYGVPWEQVLHLSATVEKIAAALRANGLWTFSDLIHNQQAALGVLQSVYGAELSTLIRAAHDYEEVTHDS